MTTYTPDQAEKLRDMVTDNILSIVKGAAKTIIDCIDSKRSVGAKKVLVLRSLSVLKSLQDKLERD